ncbi:uncharacterized protein LOC110278718 [Arachis duranensis]|uniref:Uncharacterized protein LOC110278718 n=1 Tax=Arachis duranensis TaxID=130453 RepID=A0A6P5NBY4_ARADU|nr:uncharacterized protein LOC110278718 [Arachis duranensis]
MSSQWLSKAFMKKICENPKTKLKTLIKKAHTNWNVDLTNTKATRVKQQALDEINGTCGEQYRRIHDYSAELLRSNPGSTVRIQVQRPPEFQLETPIPEAREKPIVSMLEDIRVYLMNRWAENRQSIITYNGEILLKINTKIEREFDKGGEWLAIYAGRDKYEVSNSQGNRDKFVVDLKLHGCSCRKFQITGYPCVHAMSCIKKMCLDVKNYVNKCYKKDTYVDCYQHVIYPMNGSNMWDRTQNDDVLPPVFKKPIGHQKLSRNKAGDESCNNGPLSKLSRARQQ